MKDNRIRLDPDFISFLRLEAAKNGFSNVSSFTKNRAEMLKKTIMIGDTKIDKKKKFEFRI